MRKGGVIAAGDPLTAEAGAEILKAGGNAFDAAIAATLMSFVAESTLTSPGGGGFLLSSTAGHEPVLFDFFTQTPGKRNTSDHLDFYPAFLNFGDSKQEFMIGLASAAVPGNIAGLFHVHQRLGSLPFAELAAPAIHAAKTGVTVTPYLLYNFHLVSDMILAEEASRKVFKPGDKLLAEGDRYYMPDFADLMEVLAKEGPREFYEGEVARAILKDCEARGAHLTTDDFLQYGVVERKPLQFTYRNHDIFTNPPPSAGGSLIAFMLKLLDHVPLDRKDFGTAYHLNCLVDAMKLTAQARTEKFDQKALHEVITQLFDPEYVAKLGKEIEKHAQKSGSTTHLTVADREGNIASVTTSFGTGCGYIIPGTDCMLNNMLGEEDLNPHGFHHWPLNQRITSMMSPTLVFQEKLPFMALGTGGANRIRTAILQAISNAIDFKMDPDSSVNAPRIHWENGVFSYEPGYRQESILGINHIEEYQRVEYQHNNMFFGGVHAIFWDKSGKPAGAGDRRREGIVIEC